MKTEELKKWFLINKRDLPWREELTPYRVWVSEIMLQQTQVAVVIPYYLRWMARFPTIEALASATIEEVVKEWEGLGYYSRARNLHEGAKYIESHYGGQFPENAEDLLKIKGIGSYTVGAIRSFAFHKKTPAIDGNVIRVMTRVYGIEGDIGKAKTLREIRSRVESILPDEEPWVFNEAMIELGAKVCTKQPKCCECPLKKNCYSFQHRAWDRLPYKTAKTKYITLHRAVAVIVSSGRLLVKKGAEGKVMEGLYEFPYFDCDLDQMDDACMLSTIKEEFSIQVVLKQKLQKQSHSFTRYRVHLYPQVYESAKAENIAGYQWMSFDEAKHLAFSSGHRRVYHSMDFLHDKN